MCLHYFPEPKSNTFKHLLYRKWNAKHAAGISNPSRESIDHILKNTQYGKCVFKCNNDIVDGQTLNPLYEDDVTLTFTMTAFNRGGRSTHIFGTKGELWTGESKISLLDFETSETKDIPIIVPNPNNIGYSGGDYGLVCALYYDYILGHIHGKRSF